MRIKKTKLFLYLKRNYFLFRRYFIYVILCFKDGFRFYRYSSALRKPASPKNLRALIAIEHHRIEKGLAMPNPKYPFGVEVVSRLLDLIERYRLMGGSDWICQDTVHSLEAYFERHKSCEAVKGLWRRYTEIRAETVGSQDPVGATVLVTKESLIKSNDFDFERFLLARHSVRDFAPGPVSSEKIRAAVTMAGRAPSVCNRQPWKVLEVREPAKVAELCRIQGGSRGFSEMVSSLLVTVVDLREFHGIGERNEGWVDGGIFLGNLLLALHSQGLGACPLNWCVAEKVDRMARRLLPMISDSQIIIALTAVGNLQDQFQCARSERRPVEEIFEVVS